MSQEDCSEIVEEDCYCQMEEEQEENQTQNEYAPIPMEESEDDQDPEETLKPDEFILPDNYMDIVNYQLRSLDKDYIKTITAKHQEEDPSQYKNEIESPSKEEKIQNTKDDVINSYIDDYNLTAKPQKSKNKKSHNKKQKDKKKKNVAKDVSKCTINNNKSSDNSCQTKESNDKTKENDNNYEQETENNIPQENRKKPIQLSKEHCKMIQSTMGDIQLNYKPKWSQELDQDKTDYFIKKFADQLLKQHQDQKQTKPSQ
ncbi:hypothetical protein WA158_006506 [Blastocystis sp. Blastoise]